MSEPNSLPHPTLPSSRTLIVSLGLIAMISGLFIVLAVQLTKDRIAFNKQQALEKAIFAVLPAASQSVKYKLDESGLVRLPDSAAAGANLYAAYDAEGKMAGLAMEASARGYQDVVTILYGYSLEQECVVGMTVLQSTETPGLGDKANNDPEFHANFKKLDARLNTDGSAVANPIVTVKNGRKVNPWEIDGISGATVTSMAIGKALQDSTTRMLPLVHKYKGTLQMNLNE